MDIEIDDHEMLVLVGGAVLYEWGHQVGSMPIRFRIHVDVPGDVTMSGLVNALPRAIGKYFQLGEVAFAPGGSREQCPLWIDVRLADEFGVVFAFDGARLVRTGARA